MKIHIKENILRHITKLNSFAPYAVLAKVESKANSKFKIFILSFTLFFLLMQFIYISPLSHSETSMIFPQKGMCYTAWNKDQFLSQYSNKSLEKLASLGVDYISICPTHYQQKYNSPIIKRTNQTPSRKSLIHVIRKAHKLGLNVMLKPHIDLIDKFDGTYWRADIGFTLDKDWEKWFKGYQEIILDYADLAERLNIELLCIGTELSFAATKESRWHNIISEIRKVYKGQLVYAANWDNYKNIKFWPELDYVGINAYFPLTYKSAPSLEDLTNGWEKWKYEIKIWQTKINKPVIFTEIGYPCTSHAPYAPWQNATRGNADPKIQAKCYEAFFEAVWQEPWLAGVYWWKWDTNIYAGGINNRQFTPQNKPAQNIIEANYKKPVCKHYIQPISSSASRHPNPRLHSSLHSA